MATRTIEVDKSSFHEQLAASLPKPINEKNAPAELRDIFKRISAKKLPVGALLRLGSVGSMQAGIAMSYLAYWLRGAFATTVKKEKLLNEAHLAAALKLLSTMGYMRGAVMKVGQVIANLPEVVPNQFAEVLGALHFEAPPMHYAMVREVFVAEMGCEPEEIFGEFDKKPFAAASLGQVHLARLQTGQQVAVKIQYPHIGRTIRADLRNLRLLLAPMYFSPDWRYLMDLLQEVEQILTMETDYEQEAQFCRQAGELFNKSEQIVIPKVFDRFCSSRILAMEFLPGIHLNEFLAENPSQELRNHYTGLLTKIWGRLFYSGGRLFADPHPGTFIFMDTGRLGLIDFGCTRVLSSSEKELLIELEDGFFTHDMARFDRAIARAALHDDPAGMDRDQLDTIRRSSIWSFAPLCAEGIFDWGDEQFFRQGVDLFLEVLRKRCNRSMPFCFWTTRLIFGFRAICYRLRGQIHFADLCRQERAAGRDSWFNQ